MVDVEASDRIVLRCRGCGELMILLGRENDWERERRTTFACGGCGKRVDLADRVGGRTSKLAGLLLGGSD